MTVDAGDHHLTFSPHDYIGRKVFRKSHFDRDKVNRLLSIMRERNLLRADGVLLELGANIGTQSLYFALSRSFKTIVSVEPDPRNFKLLSVNINQNNLGERIKAFNVAVGESEGKIDFYMNGKNHGKSSAIRQSASDAKIQVDVKPAPAILQEAGVSTEEISLIWMDIEGYEPVASRSMIELLARRTPFYMEFSPVFYGEEGTRRFTGELSEHYENCIAFFEDDGERFLKVRDLPTTLPQYDILLLP